MISKSKLLFLVSIASISLLLFYVEASTTYETATIKSIKFSDEKVTLYLQNSDLPHIIFTNDYLNLKKGDSISFSGRENSYNGKEQMIIEEIYLIS